MSAIQKQKQSLITGGKTLCGFHLEPGVSRSNLSAHSVLKLDPLCPLRWVSAYLHINCLSERGMIDTWTVAQESVMALVFDFQPEWTGLYFYSNTVYL